MVHSHDRNSAKWHNRLMKGFRALPGGLRDTRAGQTAAGSLKWCISQLLHITQNWFLLEKKKKKNLSKSVWIIQVALLFRSHSLHLYKLYSWASLLFCLSQRADQCKKASVLIVAQPHVYFYNTFQLSEDEGKSVLLLRLRKGCLCRLNDSIYHS